MLTGLQWPGGLTAISVIPCNAGAVRQECQTVVHKSAADTWEAVSNKPTAELNYIFNICHTEPQYPSR